MIYFNKITVFLVCLFGIICSCSFKQDKFLKTNNLYPWCIVAYDSMQRSPQERISMLKELGFTKYAYDWREKHLDDTETELKLARENKIEIISVWLWLNAERDSLGRLSPSNERIFEILKAQQIKTTLWVSFSNNFFKNLTQEQSIFKATEFITFVYAKAQELDCNIALYNHSGWFGDINNQIEIINTLPQHKLTMVYNFHHAHQYLDDFPQIAQKIMPYLACVNLNGMTKDGPKISPIGSGDFEKDMIKQLRDNGFKGPWGIMGHVENKDAKSVLEQNINGLRSLITK